MSRRTPSSQCSRSPNDKTDDIGVYLHLPFCVSKCSYCDFDSVPLESAGGLPFVRRYLDALAIELDLRAASGEFHGARAATVYLGGGTPTVLQAEWLAEVVGRVRNRFAVAPGAEITVEANPGTVDEAEAASLLQAGVNRISLGVQSFSDATLQVLGRAHSAAEAGTAIAAMRAAGCGNLNVDLIYGVPGQSLESWKASLQTALAAGPDHISAYALSVEPGTRLAEEIHAGRRTAPHDELYAEMHALAADALTGAGYRHYEISNFARPGYECRHNRRYWANGEYLGLGCSAHSHRGGVRWNNRAGPEVYVEWVNLGQLPVAQAECLSARRRLGEMLMLGLRCDDGVSEEEVFDRCGVRPREVFESEIEQLRERGLLAAADGRLRIPRGKWIVSNEVLSCFVA